MAIFYLIGGTGNQLFQYAASDERDRFSAIFLSRPVRRALNWTDHETLFSYSPKAGLLGLLGVIPLVLDGCLAKIFRRSLVTEFDTRGLHVTPLIGPWMRCGYYQRSPGARDVSPLAAQFSGEAVRAAPIVVHVRGGDFLKLAASGQGANILQPSYYATSLAQALDLCRQEGTPPEVLVVTDDPEHARSLFAQLDLNVPVKIARLELAETLQHAIAATVFVSSNSTLSYWMVRLRGNAPSLAPLPFHDKGDWEFGANVTRLPATFGVSADG